MRQRKLLAMAASALAVAAARVAVAATPGTPVSGDLFYTTFASFDQNTLTFGTATVDKVHFSFDGSAGLNFSGQTNLASMPSGQNADGIIFDTGGNLLVGSAGINVSVPLAGINVSGTNQIVRFTQAGAQTGSAVTPDGPFHLTLSPDGGTVYSGGTFGPVNTPVGTFNLDGDTAGNLVATKSDMSAAGAIVPTSGADTTFTQVAFVPGGKVFYVNSGATGSGSYGTIDLTTGVTTQIAADFTAAHGILYDAFSNSIIMTGGTDIAQVDPDTGAVVSTRTIGTELDQGSVDGFGHLFVGDNNGSIAFVDFSNTKSIGDASDPAFEQFLQNNLDDLAPLNASGPPVIITPPPVTGVPVPPAVYSGLALLGVLGIAKRLRRPMAV